MHWCPVWCGTESACSVSENFIFRSRTESFHSLYWFFLYYLFFLLISKLLVLCSFFFFSYVFCLISPITFFNSSVFSFIILSRKFLSVIAVMYFDINNSSGEMVLKLHSFSISNSHLQNSSGVSSSVCFAQKKTPRLW